MVSFTQKLANFYVRDPRQTPRQTNPFYQDYAGSPSNYPGSYQQIYNPTSYNPYNSPVGVAGFNGPVQNGASALGAGNFAAGFAGGLASTLVPGLNGAGLPPFGINTSQPTNDRYAYPTMGLPNPTLSRLLNNNLPPGADYSGYINGGSTAPIAASQINGGQDDRVIVTDPSGHIVGSSAVIQPLEATGGVLFPYTPTITFGHKANYESENLIHTNYEHLYYKNSTVDQIGIQAKFTANNAQEALYVLGVIWFFRAATKMFYGQDSIAGTPPPVLRLDGYGQMMMDHLPVVCVSFDFTLPEDVDYISTNITNPYDAQSDTGGESFYAKVPTNMQMNVGFKLVYSRNAISNKFGLDQFAKGALLSGGGPGQGGPGGWI